LHLPLRPLPVLSDPSLKETENMTKTTRNLVAAAFLAGFTALASTAASANGCPADQMGENALGNAPTKPVGVTDTVLESIDLAKQMVKLDDHQLRIRRLEIQPGGIVPLHDHADRPALIYIVSGEITEYASNCKTGIVHKAGETSRDADLRHWWKNTSKKPVVLISADILHDVMDQNM
jgi:quercetin dioxygenase-like cupin family protein